MPGRDGRGEELRRCLVVAAEAELDLAVVEDRRRGDPRLGGELVARGLEAVAAARIRTRRTAPNRSRRSMSADPAVGEDLAVVDDRDRSCTAPRARAGCGC